VFLGVAMPLPSAAWRRESRAEQSTAVVGTFRLPELRGWKEHCWEV